MLQLFLLLISWIGVDAVAFDSSRGVEEYLADKENKVRLLASDALRLALDREECGTGNLLQECFLFLCPLHSALKLLVWLLYPKETSGLEFFFWLQRGAVVIQISSAP